MSFDSIIISDFHELDNILNKINIIYIQFIYINHIILSIFTHNMHIHIMLFL